MNSDELPELPSDVAAMLRAERQAPEPSASARDAVYARVTASASGTAPAAPGSMPAPPATAGALAGGAKSVMFVVVALGVIGGSVALWVSNSSRPVARVPVVRFASRPSALRGMLRPVAQLDPAPELPARGESVPTSPVAPATLATPPTPTIARVAPPGAHADPGVLADDIGDERALLDPVRAAVARQDAATARTALQAYAERYPHGRLAEERDGMWIEVFALEGDHAGAEARATAFRRRYPNSILLPAIEASLRDRQ